MPSRPSKRKLSTSSPPSSSTPSSSSSTAASPSVHPPAPTRTPYNRSSLHRFANRHGDVLSFGSGDMSQLGLGDDDAMRERKKPTLLKTLATANVVSIAAGSLHNAAIVEGGGLLTWGCNDDGALGRGGDEWLPAPVDGPLGTPAAHGDPATEVVQVACGASHTVALTATGAVYAWGTYRDGNGVLGFSSTVDTAAAPVRLDIAETVVMIAAGENHDLALTDKGNVLQWGDVGHGQRALDRHKKNKLHPTSVAIRKRGGGRGGSAVRCDFVYAGGASSFAVTADGAVYSWGPNNYSQTGHRQAADEEKDDAVEAEETKAGDAPPNGGAVEERPQKRRRKKKAAFPVLFVSIPTLVPGLPPIRKVAAAIHHTLFLTAERMVMGVGKNLDGRLGLGHQRNVDTPTLSGPPQVMDIGVGEVHSLIVVGRGDDGGALYTCGDGTLLQLGNGLDSEVAEWYLVHSQQLDKENRRVLQAVGGSQHSLILAVRRSGAFGLTAEEEAKLVNDTVPAAPDAV